MSLLGERLRQVREKRGISPLQVEIETRIRANVIQALEEGDFESLPPEPFLRGLIRSYSNYLGVDSQEMLDLYAADIAPVLPVATPRPFLPRKPAAPSPPPPSIPEPIRATSPTALPYASAAQPAPFSPDPIATPASAITTGADVPPPPAPPETLAPPERLDRTLSANASDAAPVFLAHITRRGIPLPVVILVGIAVVLSCVAATLVLVTKVGPAIISNAGAATPTRAPATATPTLRPGAPATSIPTLAVTAAPFATLPGNPIATSAGAPLRTPEATPGLTLDVDVTQTITLSVGIDGVMVFSGALPPGTTRSWNAPDTLYVRVENIKGATISLNGNPKSFGARNFTELAVLERMWTVNDQGTPISAPPVAPASTPAATPAALPSPTLTPFS